MKRKQLFQYLALVSFVGLAACSSPWKVVRKAETNPFTKSERYVVTEVKTNNLQVGDLAEAVYLNQIGSAERRRWRVGKSVFTKSYGEALKANLKGMQVAVTGKVKPNDFQVYTQMYFVSPFTENQNTKVKIRVRLMQRNKTYDVLLLQYEVPKSKGRIGNRLKAAGAEFGKRLAKYLNERVR